MKIAGILCSHGLSSEFLIKTSEIILGNQDNISYINFSVGDSLDKLNELYLKSLRELDVSNGIICMVDMWGGSPFNIACKIFINSKYNYSIVSGVNIPMLIDFFMIREKNNLEEVTKSIINSAKIGINSLINNK